MTSNPTQPTARERFEKMSDKKFDYLENIQFLIALVEAAVAEAKEYCERMHEDGFADYHRDNDVWEGIDQRLAEGKSK